MIAEYLAAALEDSNPDVFLSALGDVAKARGMVNIKPSRLMQNRATKQCVS